MASFDEHLYSLKLREPSHRMQVQTEARLRQADAEQKATGQGPGTGWLVKRVDAAMGVFREQYVQEIDKACRETWLSDHDCITPEFIRGVLLLRIFTSLAARKGAIQGEIELLARRVGIGGTQVTPALHHLVHETGRLQGDLSTHYEIEARELEKRAARAYQVTQAPAPATPDCTSWGEYRNNYIRKQEEADGWQDFHSRFMQLAREEQGLGRADVITNGKALRRMEVLRAHCDYKDYRERVFVAEEVRSFYESLGVELTSEDLSKIEAKMLEWTELEKKAGLKAPETGRWTYGTGAVSENSRERVRLCVVEAGRSLPDYPKGTDPEDFWLHQLYLDLLKNDSDLLFCGTKEGGMILSVCVASATFCSRLARKALEQAEPGGQSVPSQPVERGIAEATGERPPFAQNENLRNAILKKKARVTEIERTLNQALPTEHRGRPVHGGGGWRLRLEEERQHLLIAVQELEAELQRSTFSGTQNSDKTAPGVESKPTIALADTKMRIGRNIDKLRKECGWSLDRLCAKTGIDKKAILSHVHGKSKPNPNTLKEYAQAFAKELNRSITANTLEE
jgi:hypothetical protein